ncbi:hypothetical protein [Rhodococcus wratislaviensis]|nr:hypothetical protein [Rhodococcus wratislaviensis]
MKQTHVALPSTATGSQPRSPAMVALAFGAAILLLFAAEKVSGGAPDASLS